MVFTETGAKVWTAVFPTGSVTTALSIYCTPNVCEYIHVFEAPFAVSVREVTARRQVYGGRDGEVTGTMQTVV
jgi:hypothetical protein